MPPAVATISVDSTYPGYSPGAIHDGVINPTGGTATTWASAASPTAAHWVTVSFASPTAINYAAIYWAYNNAQGRLMTSQRVDIQYWNGATYLTAASVLYPGVDVPSSSVTFASVTTTAIRFYQPANMGPPSYSTVLWLTEIDYKGPAVTSGGGTVLFHETFADAAFTARGWYDGAMAMTTAQHIPGSTGALEAHFLPGSALPTWGGPARHLFQPTSTVYVSYWVKYSANWVGSGQPWHPHEFMVLSNLDGNYDNPAFNWLNVYIEQNYQAGGIPRIAVQDNNAINMSYGVPPLNLVGITENRSTSGCNGVFETALSSSTCYNNPPWYNAKTVDAAGVYFQPNPGPGYKGDWNRVEVYFQLNSVVGGIGQPDGVMQFWFNGALVIDRHDIMYRTGARASLQFQQFVVGPYMNSSPVDQTAWYDDLIVATSHP
jgi:hypothetical protein